MMGSRRRKLFGLRRAFRGARGRAGRRCAARKLHLGLESLEARRMLAPVINEIHFPIVTATDQYVEIRAGANETLGEGVYLAVVDGDAPIGGNPGVIHTLFDLSGLQTGANGFLAIRQQGSPYPVHPDAAVIEGTTSGFGGLRGASDPPQRNRFSDTTTVTDRIDHTLGSNTFFLLQSDVAPVAGEDIDGDDDGTPDALVSNWTILDSISVLDGGAADLAYAPLAYAKNGAGQAPLGAAVVPTTPAIFIDYVGRNDDTAGSTPADWVAAETKTFGDPQGWSRLSERTTLPREFTGRRLDHLGAPNFLASILGTVFLDADGDGLQDGGESGLPGETVFLDQNGNGLWDSFTTVVEPDDFPVWSSPEAQETTIRNDVPGVTFTVAGTDNAQHSDAVPVSVVEAPPGDAVTGTRVFSQAGVNFFNDGFRLRMDFYEPIQSLSIAVRGSGDGTVGRLIAYDRDGEEIASVDSRILANGQSQTLSLNRDAADIKMAVAYGFTAPDHIAGFAHFDHLRFTQPERSAVTDAQGAYQFARVFPGLPGYPGAYAARHIAGAGMIRTFPSGDGAHAIAVVDTANLQPFDFGARPNQPPEVAPQTFSIDENSPVGAVVGVVAASDPDPGQTVSFEVAGGSGQGLFAIHSQTGRITVRSGAVLNFEATASYTLDVTARDNGPNSLEATAAMTININDVNEPPTAILLSDSQIPEDVDASNGPVKAADLATNDPDAGAALAFTLVDEPGGGANDNALFEIQGQELLLRQGVVLDHETQPTLRVRIQAADATHSFEETLTLTVTDVDEPATTVILESNAVSEDADASAGPVLIGALTTDDPDANASYTFSLVAGGGGLFQIQGVQLLLAQGASLDFETQSSYLLRIEASDDAGSLEADVTVLVTDANDPPQIEAQTLTVEENSPAGTRVGVATASDPDAGQTATLTIVGGSGASAFALDPASGEVTVADAAALDFEATPSLTLVVRATDDGDPQRSIEATITINLVDADDGPTDILFEPFLVREDADTASGPVAAGRLTAVFAAGGENAPHGFEIAGGADADAFQIDGDLLKIARGVELDHETRAVMSVVVRAASNAGAVERTFEVAIADVDENRVWRNAAFPEDADQDGDADLVDLIAVVEFLRRRGATSVDVRQTAPEENDHRVDVDGNGLVNIQDLLEIVNYLRARLGEAEPESAGDGAARENSPLDPQYASAVSFASPLFLRLSPDDEDDPWERILNDIAADAGR